MTLGWLHLVAVLIVPALLGAAVLRLIGIGWRTDRVAFPAWCWIVGAPVVGLIGFAWLAAGKPLPGPWLMPLIGAAAMAVWFFARNRRPTITPAIPPAGPSTPIGTALLAGVVLALGAWTIDGCIQRMAEPVSHGDEADTWTAQAKVFAAVDGLDEDFGATARLHVFRSEYPPLNGLIQFWVFAAAGEITWVENRIPIQLFGLALLLLLASALRRVTSPWIAALLLVLVWSQKVPRAHLLTAYADVMIACLLFAAVDLWLRWRATARPAFGGLALAMLAAGLLTKNDGTAHFAAFVVATTLAALLFRRSGPWLPRPWLAWIAPLAAIAGVTVYRAVFGLETDMFGDGVGNVLFRPEGADASFRERLLTQSIERVWPVFQAFAYRGLIDPERSRWLLLALAAAVALWPRRLLRGDAFVVVTVIAAVLAAYFAVHLVSPYPPEVLIDAALDRILFHVAPLTALALAMGWRCMPEMPEAAPASGGDGRPGT